MEILYSDSSIVVCIKPAGVSSQDDGKPSCMVRQLMEIEKAEYIGVVHRLDKEVSGVMVYAKTPKAAAGLSKQITDGIFKKEYRAVIIGEPYPSSGKYIDLLFHDSTKNKSFAVKRERKGVRKASLEYETIETVSYGEKSLSLVDILLHTGRTHQIRVQFSSRKMPLMGDRKYGGGGDCKIALFSKKLSFLHPETGKPLSFSVKTPAEFPWDKFSV